MVVIIIAIHFLLTSKKFGVSVFSGRRNFFRLLQRTFRRLWIGPRRFRNLFPARFDEPTFLVFTFYLIYIMFAHRWRIRLKLLILHGNARSDNSSCLAPFSCHLGPREKKNYLNIACCFYRRQESNPGRLHSNPLLCCLSARMKISILS